MLSENSELFVKTLIKAFSDFRIDLLEKDHEILINAITLLSGHSKVQN